MIRRRIWILLVLSLTGCCLFCSGEAPERSELFAFCHDLHDSGKRSLAQQAAMLKELGYAGCGHVWLQGVEKRAATLSAAGLRLFQVYVLVDLSKPQPVDEDRIAAILPALKVHETQLALLIKGGRPSDPALDDKAVTLLRRLSNRCEPFGIDLVLYPHTGDWVETCSDAVRVAGKVNQPGRVGVMFNLCHWMKADDNRDLGAVLKQAEPWLKAVSLSGSDNPEDVRSGKGNWIQPLGQGGYDLSELMRLLDEGGYSGMIGLQCFGIGGDAAVHLDSSMREWRLLTRQGVHPKRRHQ